MAELALVTGGDTGIGKAIAEALYDAGYEVRSASRRNGFDLTERESIDQIVDELPRLDLLVNNAGIAESAPLAKTDDAMWDRHMALNVTAPFLLCRAAQPLLAKSEHGCIVNVASTAGLSGAPYIAAYAASKHALVGLTRALAAELENIAVHCACPGFVDTPLLERSVETIVALTGMDTEKARASLAAMNKSGKLIQPIDVAAAVVKLAQAKDTGRELILE